VALMLQLQILHNKAACIIPHLPPCASDTESLDRLMWKLLSRRRAEHRAIFMFKCLNNFFINSSNIAFNRDYHECNTRFKDNIRKTVSKRNWGHWTSTNFAANEWNNLDKSLREIRSLDKYTRFQNSYFWNYNSFIRRENCERFSFYCNLSPFVSRF
jgi:hypothetical protein